VPYETLPGGDKPALPVRDGARPHGRAVQVDLIKPTLRAPGTKRLKLQYDGPLSSFAFKFNLRRYTTGAIMHVAKVTRPEFLGVGLMKRNVVESEVATAAATAAEKVYVAAAEAATAKAKVIEAAAAAAEEAAAADKAAADIAAAADTANAARAVAAVGRCTLTP